MERYAVILAAFAVSAAAGCTVGGDGETGETTAPREQRVLAATEQDADGAQARLSWGVSATLPDFPSARQFELVAPDPSTHAFAVRVQHAPASAEVFVRIKTSYGNLSVFDPYVQPFMISDSVHCEEGGASRACLMRFPNFMAERAGTWTVIVEKASNFPADVRVEVSFTPVGPRSGARASREDGLRSKRRFDRNGIAFDYPSMWFASTRPLSHAGNPVYRFAVSSVPVRRTAADSGPCLPGVARQLPPDAVLVYLREALGADRRLSLPRMKPRPARFRLPGRTDLCGFERGRARWYDFKDDGRAFYVGMYVGPEAPRTAWHALGDLLGGMEITRRG